MSTPREIVLKTLNPDFYWQNIACDEFNRFGDG